MKYITYLILPLLSLCCISSMDNNQDAKNDFSDPFIDKTEYLSNTFIYPVGDGEAKDYYNAQKFRENNHLGEDWNKTSGGNTDLGEPILSIANGYVTFAKDVKGGWGNVIRILHKTKQGKFIESLYAHCDSIYVSKGDYIKMKDQIGTIGTAHDKYLAHLHFEIRNKPNMPLGGGYSIDASNFLCPTDFIETHR